MKKSPCPLQTGIIFSTGSLLFKPSNLQLAEGQQFPEVGAKVIAIVKLNSLKKKKRLWGHSNESDFIFALGIIENTS